MYVTFLSHVPMDSTSNVLYYVANEYFIILAKILFITMINDMVELVIGNDSAAHRDTLTTLDWTKRVLPNVENL